MDTQKERPALSNRFELLLTLFTECCDKDSFQIETYQHLQFAYAFIESIVGNELGQNAKDYLETWIRPIYLKHAEHVRNLELLINKKEL